MLYCYLRLNPNRNIEKGTKVRIMITLQQVVDILIPIFEKQGIDKVTVFGSYARGDFTSTSDIDMVIDSNGRLKGIMFFAASDEIAKALPIKSDIYEQREIIKDSTLYNDISREGVVVYER